MSVPLKLLHNSKQNNLLQFSISAMPVVDAYLTISFLQCVEGSTIVLLFLDLTCLLVENVLSHTYAFPNVERIFSAKPFSYFGKHIFAD